MKPLVPRQLEALTQRALDAFWAVIVAEYPQFTTGDLSPTAAVRLYDAAEFALDEWILGNC